MTAKVLVEELMNSLLPVAHQMLAEHREFYPYGGYMDRDGRITHVGVKDGGNRLSKIRGHDRRA